MTTGGEPPLARLTAVFAIVVAMAACSDTATAPPPDPAPAPPPAPAPGPAPAPDADPLDELSPAAREMRAALLAAAEAGDWDAVDALIPVDSLFTSNFGGDTDHLAYFRSVDGLSDEVVDLLEGPFAQVDDLFVWPELHARVPFAIEDSERAELEARHGADALAQWEAAGAYLGWRIGITTSGDWLFLVAGD